MERPSLPRAHTSPTQLSRQLLETGTLFQLRVSSIKREQKRRRRIEKKAMVALSFGITSFTP